MPNLGASGAIVGVLGAYILMFPPGERVLCAAGLCPWCEMSAVIVIGFWILLQVVSSLTSFTAPPPRQAAAAWPIWRTSADLLQGIVLTFLFRGRGDAPPAG